MENSFYEDVIFGLSLKRKKLPSKYFYDDKGSRLFQQIMGLPEYYLTRSEQEIIEKQSLDILQKIYKNKPLEIIELGAGDGSKTKFLLKDILDKFPNVVYKPVDISEEALSTLVTHLKKELPELKVSPIHNDYMQDFKLPVQENTTKLLLFLGSNIGNFGLAETHSFLKNISKELSIGDFFLIGFDLVKHPKVIRAAYNDSQGVTKAFNLNLLERINRELAADFDLNKFDHYESFDPELGEARSYLISLDNQVVHFKNEINP